MHHEETHSPSVVAQRLKLSLVVIGTIFVAEVVGGYLSNSLALLSDAGHVLTDLVALLLAWVTVKQAARPPTPQMTYGYHRWGILGAVVNAVTLIGICLAIFYQALHRWQNPQPVEGGLMLVVAVVGLLANIFVVLYLRAEARENLSVKGAFWHALGDALSSVGVIFAAVAILFTDWLWVDPLVSFLIGGIILAGAWRLLQEGLRVLLEAPPIGLSPVEVAATIGAVKGVKDVHDLHLWSIAPGFSILSCHLSLDDQPLTQGTRIMGEIQNLLRERFGVAHATLQLECPGCTTNCCPLPNCGQPSGDSQPPQ